MRRQLRSRGLAVAAAAFVAIAVAHRVDAAERAAARWGATESVVVVTRDLAAGEPLARDDTVLGTWPAALAPPDALHEAPIGRRLSEGIRAGQPLVGDQLAPAGRGAWAAALDVGESAVQVPLVQAMPGLDVDDVVDVVVASAGTTTPGQRVLAHDARVLQVEDAVVTVAVRDAEAATTAASVLIGATALVVRG